MPDDPIITTQEETVHVNPQLNVQITSPEQRKQLDESFANFCQEQDAKANAAPPEAPSTDPSKDQKPVSAEQGTPEKKPRAERKPKEKASPETRIPEVEQQAETDEPDPLDTLSPHPQASQKTQTDFKALKSAAKGFRQQAKVWENNLAPALRPSGTN